MNVLGYVRVSTEEQSMGAEAQAHSIRSLAQSRGWKLVDIVSDIGYSGGDPDRPGLHDVMSRACITGDVRAVIVMKLDRFTRAVSDVPLIQALAKHNVQLIASGQEIDITTAAGRLAVTMLLAVAQFEREVIAERTKEGLAQRKRNGQRYSGKVPYGYRMEDGRLAEDPEQQDILRQIRLAKELEMESERAIAERFGVGRKVVARA